MTGDEGVGGRGDVAGFGYHEAAELEEVGNGGEVEEVGRSGGVKGVGLAGVGGDVGGADIAGGVWFRLGHGVVEMERAEGEEEKKRRNGVV